MADNVDITPGSGETVAADEVSINGVTVKVQRMKLVLGADGAYDLDVDSGQQAMAASVPVVIASNQSALPITDNSGSLTVDGTVTAELSATDNAVLDTIDAVLDTINAKLVTGTDIGDVTINNSTGAAAVNIQDGGNVITVDGTVAVTNAGTFATQIDGAALTALQLIDNMISGSEAQVDVITVPAPLSTTGGGTEATALRVTIANDSTGVVSIDDNGGAITVDGTVAVTNAGITTIAGAVSGTEMQVDIVAALPAGTNAIGKLSANSGVDIGDVDVTSIAAGTNIIGATRDAGPSWTVVRTYTTSSNMTTAADLTAAPTSGQKIVLDDLIVSCGTDMVLSLQEETSGTVIMALSLTAKSPVQITPRDGLKLPTADRKLQGDASEAGTLYITACYHSEA